MRTQDWRPSATRATLERRAALLARTRRFFADRGVLEVDTPMVVNTPVSDVHLASAQVSLDDAPDGPPRFLHTSPEYAMKRLLAAGSGDIYQICHVVRGFERSRLHNAEFTLIEWYRLGFSLDDLMREVEQLVRELLGPVCSGWPAEHISYRDAFLTHLSLDPLTAGMDELLRAAGPLGYRPAQPGDCERDELLDLLLSTSVGSRLGSGRLTFLHHFPASQAALARLDPHDPRTALRFELYCEGMELANGFHELASSTAQRERFEADQHERRRRVLPVFPLDERLLAALAAGLPDCAGVAVGFDRLVMLATGASHIDAVLPFPIERA